MHALTVTNVEIPIATGVLQADLALPAKPEALVVMAHGSGSNRFSARNRAAAWFAAQLFPEPDLDG